MNIIINVAGLRLRIQNKLVLNYFILMLNVCFPYSRSICHAQCENLVTRVQTRDTKKEDLEKKLVEKFQTLYRVK